MEQKMFPDFWDWRLGLYERLDELARRLFRHQFDPLFLDVALQVYCMGLIGLQLLRREQLYKGHLVRSGR